MIQIISPTRIEVDGKDAGLPVDYILANPGLKKEINAAFIAWHESHVIAVQDKDAQYVDHKAELDAEYQLLVAENQAARDKAFKDAEGVCREADKAIAAKEAECAAFKTKCLESVAEAVAAKDAMRRACDAELETIRADMAVLGTKEEAKKLRAEQERLRDLEQFAALKAKLGLVELEPADAKP